MQYVKTTPAWVKWLLALLAVAAVAGIGYLVFKGGDKKKLSGAGEPKRLRQKMAKSIHKKKLRRVKRAVRLAGGNPPRAFKK